MSRKVNPDNRYQGLPCKKNPDHVDADGSTTRYKKGKACVHCAREYVKAYNDKRREEKLALEAKAAAKPKRTRKPKDFAAPGMKAAA